MLALSFLQPASSRLLAIGLAVMCFVFTSPALAQVRITSLVNVTTASWITGNPSIVMTDLVCIYNTANRSYALTATGGASGFFIASGSNSIPYTVTWNDGGAANPAGGTTYLLINGVKRTGLQNARIPADTPANSNTCNSGAAPTAQITITITATSMEAARDGTFTGTLTLILAAS